VLTLAQADQGGSQDDEGSEAGGGLVVAGGDAAEMLEGTSKNCGQIGWILLELA
jgi:hypothetical protein